jgi:hypothetical protein
MSDSNDFLPQGLAIGETFVAPEGIDFGSGILELKHGIKTTLTAASYPELSAVLDRNFNDVFEKEATIQNPNDVSVSQSFGIDLDFDFFGDRMIVGAYKQSATGSAFIFKRTGTSWALEQEIANPHPDPNFFGSEVMMNAKGDRVFILEPVYDNGGTIGFGVIHIWNRSGTTWTAGQQLFNDFDAGALQNSIYGTMNLSDNEKVLLVGDYEREISGVDNAGAVRIFRLYEPTDQYVHFQDIESPDGPSDAPFFGVQVDCDATGDTIVVGAPWHDYDGLSQAGSAYVYVRSGDQWVLSAYLRPTYAGVGNEFGGSIAVHPSGQLVAVGEAGASSFNQYSGENASEGIVRMYRINNENRIDEEGRITAYAENLDLGAWAGSASRWSKDMVWSGDGKTLIVSDYAWNSNRGYVQCYEFSEDLTTVKNTLSSYEFAQANRYYGAGLASTYDGSRIGIGGYGTNLVFTAAGDIEVWSSINTDTNTISIPPEYYHDYLRKYMRIK